MALFFILAVSAHAQEHKDGRAAPEEPQAAGRSEIAVGTLTKVSPESCNLPPIETCPSLYGDRCLSQEFRRSSEEIAFLCVNILAGATEDDQSCAEYDKEACDDFALVTDCDSEDINPYRAYNCQRGVPGCPDSAKRLSTRFDMVLTELGSALAPYSEVIAFEPNNVDDVALLCEFTKDEFEDLLSQSTADDQKIARFSENLEDLGQCADVARDLVEGGPPNEVMTDSLWESARNMLEVSIEGIEQRRGDLKEQITELEDAADKVKPMYGMYQGFCLD